MFQSKLFQRMFVIIVGAVTAFSIAVYVILVPLIRETAFEIELEASRTILDNVFEMARKIHDGLEAERDLAIEAHKAHLKNIVDLATAYVTFTHGRALRGEITAEEARRLIFEGMREFRYGNDDYIWITDHSSVLVSHPDPNFQGRDASDELDPSGHPIIPRIIEIARAQGEGFHTYSWGRLGRKTPSRKISYFRNFPEHGFVVGSGVYLDDIDAEVERRKREAIEDLRQALRKVRIARTGYVYIFDSNDRMLIHPNPNIETTDFGELLDPITRQPIGRELRKTAITGRPLYYAWDKPSDPGNYAYEKLSWVRHFDRFDWYIASSVYVEELRRSPELLGQRILVISLALLAAACALGYFGARWLVAPINRLADRAARVRAGNLDVESGIVRDDEIGTLASAFDGMVRQVRDSIHSLDIRVAERTAELEHANRSLSESRAALAEIEARQRLILDAVPAGIAYVGADLQMRFVNRGWAAFARRPKEDMIGSALADVMGERGMARVAPHVERALAGEEVTFELAPRSPGGTITKNTLIPEVSPDGAVAGLFILSLDITDERETERQLMEAQRLRAVGQLSGGLAHDFNNLLSVIIGNLAAARDRFAGVEGLDRHLEPAQRAARRGADITSRLLSFSRQQPLTPAPVEIVALARELGELLARSLPATIDLRLPGGEVPPCWALADHNQLQNAIVNLGLNARDAMPGGGRLCIQVDRLSAGGAIGFDEPVIEGRYIHLSVADTGCGFDREALDRAFEPFFTTKEMGSGLGLSMVYGFVKQSAGYIRIESDPGLLTVVSILLPETEAPPDSPPPRRPSCTDIRRDWAGRMVLLVEDDHDVRAMLRTELVDMGLSVIEAANGDEAVVLAEGIEDIDLVLSDVMMPGRLNGFDLMRHLRRTRPHLGLLLISGFPSDDREAFRGLEDVEVLRKPWETHELATAVARCFHGRAERAEAGPGAE